MAQFNIDVDSGTIRISQLIYGICPGMSQATMFPRVFVVYALIREGLVHLKRVRNIPLTCVMVCWAQLLVNLSNTYTHYTVQPTAKSSSSLGHFQDETQNAVPNTKVRYQNTELPKCFVSPGLGKIQYQNTIPNPPPGHGWDGDSEFACIRKRN